MYHYRTLCTSNEKGFSALWGKFAADILMQDWDTALEDMARLREVIDSKVRWRLPSDVHMAYWRVVRRFGLATRPRASDDVDRVQHTTAPWPITTRWMRFVCVWQTIFTPLNQLQQRMWLMHWSLFVFFNHENGRNSIIDLFFQERYMNAIQTNAHHLLRYLAAAVVVNKRRRNVLKDLIRVIQQEAHSYSDPITEFLECLFVHYDFEGAQVKLRQCEAVLDQDFFLQSIKEEFVENARLFVFETYCRIHQCIDIKMLAQKLNMDDDAAELWIVKLIRSAKLHAKIDSKAGTVIMGTQHLGIYEQIIDKTRQLSLRSYELASNTMKHAAFTNSPALPMA